MTSTAVTALKVRPMGWLHFFIMLLLVPAFLEAIDDALFLVAIPGFPLSMGKVALVGAGLLGAVAGGRTSLTSPAAMGIALVSIGCTLGALFSGDALANLSRSAGLILLFAGAAGTASLWGMVPFRRALDGFFIATMAYWLLYVVRVLAGAGGASYGQLFVAGAGEVENHHVPGLYLSICGVYLALRFFYQNGRMRIGGFAVFAAALVGCLVIESRANLGFTAIALLVVMLQERRGLGGRVFVALPLLFGMYLGLAAIVGSSEGIQRQLDLENQTQAADTRVGLVVAGIDAIVSQPWGRGILNIRVTTARGRVMQAHNQYVTYGIAGGVVALIGVFIWQWDYLRILMGARARKRRPTPEPIAMADALMLLVMYVTLLTLEFTGMVFFIALSVGIYRSGVLAAERRKGRVDATRRRRAQPGPAGPASPHGGQATMA